MNITRFVLPPGGSRGAPGGVPKGSKKGSWGGPDPPESLIVASVVFLSEGLGAGFAARCNIP